MKRYALNYRLGLTPWEGYPQAAAASIRVLLDREEVQRSRPLGRALDLGCGRGHYTRELASRGWQAVGVDYVPQAIDAAERGGIAGTRYALLDVTELAASRLGRFDFFLDVGCFQGLTRKQRLAEGYGVTALAEPAATLLMLAFQPTFLRWGIGGVSPADVEEAFPRWQTVAVEPATTAGLGWPISRTAPQWYRLRRRAG